MGKKPIEKHILIIIGAGAVENAWNPIIAAINNVFGIETDEDGANLVLAREVYLCRFYSSIKHPTAPKLLEIRKNLTALKEEIALQIGIAQLKRELRIRDEFYKILGKYVSNRNVSVVTTNWDNVVDEAINELFMRYDVSEQPEILHLHGNIDSPDSFYLPSEITPEPYRDKEQEKLIGTNHIRFGEALQKAHEVIFYGISLDPLDVELTLSLSGASVLSNLEKVIIVNPEFEKTSNRIKLILSHKKDITLELVNPNKS